MNFKITDPIDFSIEIESLYIAHVFQNISKKRISTVFNNLFLANVKGIDLVTKIGKDGKPYNSAYIHIESWFDNSAAKYFQEKIRSDSEALLVYDEPWYWIVNENKSTEKSRFIRKAEEERFEGAQKQANDDISEMLMMLDSLEYICSKNSEELNVLNEDYEVFQAEYEEEEYNFLSEHKEEEEYFNKND